MERPEVTGNLLRFAQWSVLSQAVEHLWSRRKYIGKWVIIGLVISFLLAWRLPKFEATTQLMPPDNSSSGGLAALALSKASGGSGVGAAGLAGLAGDALGIKNSGALFVKVLTSRTVLDALIRRFDLRKRYSVGYWEDARLKLVKQTTIDDDKKSGVITISVRDRDPGLATALAAAYVEELDRLISRVSTSSARREREFIEQRLVEERNTLHNSEEQFSKFASTNMTLDVPEQAKLTVEAAARLQGEMIAARAELQGLQQIYSIDNIRVRSLAARVGELEHELARINSGRLDVGATQDPIRPYPSVKNLPLLGVAWANLYRDVKLHSTVLELLTQQYETARIQEAKEIPIVKILDPSSVSEHKAPSALLIILSGLFISLLLACAGVLLSNLWRKWNDAQIPG